MNHGIFSCIEITEKSGAIHLFTRFMKRERTLSLMQFFLEAQQSNKKLADEDIVEIISNCYGNRLDMDQDELIRHMNQVNEPSLTVNGNQLEPNNNDTNGLDKSDDDDSDSEYWSEQSDDEDESNVKISKRKLSKKRYLRTTTEVGGDDSSSLSSQSIDDHAQPDEVVAHSCQCSQHAQMMIIDEVIDMPVDQLYQLIFGNNATFIDQLHKSRNTNDLKVTKWADFNMDEDRDGIDLAFASPGDITLPVVGPSRQRQLNYTVNLDNPLAKRVQTHEKQFVLEHRPGVAYVVFSQAKNSGVTFSDTFHVNSSWCLSAINSGGGSQRQTKLMVHYNITFVRNPFSMKMFKSIIESNSLQGITKYSSDLIVAIRKFLDEGVDIGAYMADKESELDADSLRLTGSSSTTTDGQLDGETTNRSIATQTSGPGELSPNEEEEEFRSQNGTDNINYYSTFLSFFLTVLLAAFFVFYFKGELGQIHEVAMIVRKINEDWEEMKKTLPGRLELSE